MPGVETLSTSPGSILMVLDLLIICNTTITLLSFSMQPYAPCALGMDLCEKSWFCSLDSPGDKDDGSDWDATFATV